jgi:hypothetical protein
MTLPSFLAPPSPPFTPRSPSSLRLADTARYQSFLLPRRRRCRHRPTSPSHLATNVDSSILAAKVPPPPASPRFAGPRRLPSPCAVRARALVPAHSCQRADNVLFWPAVTSPPFSLRRPPRRRRAPSPPRSAALPIAAAPPRHQGPPPSPSPPRAVAAKVRRPPRRRRPPSPLRSAALPVGQDSDCYTRRSGSSLRPRRPTSPPRLAALSQPLSPRR